MRMKNRNYVQAKNITTIFDTREPNEVIFCVKIKFKNFISPKTKIIG